MTRTFSFELDTKYMKHLKDKSHYNHNYYELDLNNYGDYIIPEMCDILYVSKDAVRIFTFVIILQQRQDVK